jgi:hypothetical protein
MITGTGHVKRAFRKFSNTDYFPIARAIKNSYVEQVYEVDAIKTGRFVQSIDWRRGILVPSMQSFFVDTSKDQLVTYDGWVEHGTAKMPARFPARRGIVAADLEPIFDVMVDDAFSPVLL